MLFVSRSLHAPLKLHGSFKMFKSLLLKEDGDGASRTSTGKEFQRSGARFAKDTGPAPLFAMNERKEFSCPLVRWRWAGRWSFAHDVDGSSCFAHRRTFSQRYFLVSYIITFAFKQRSNKIKMPPRRAKLEASLGRTFTLGEQTNGFWFLKFQKRLSNIRQTSLLILICASDFCLIFDCSRVTALPNV